jgi:hypothetical protein
MLDKNDASSDNRILAKTAKYPSPDHQGAVRFEATMPWGDKVMLDFAEVNMHTANTWTAHVREQINERYDPENLESTRGLDRPADGEAGDTGGGPGGDSVVPEAAAPAPQEVVARPVSPAEALRQRVDEIKRTLGDIEDEIVRLKKERAALEDEYSPLVAALEVLDGSTIREPDGKSLLVLDADAGEGSSRGVGSEDAAPDGVGGLGGAVSGSEGDNETDDAVDG